MLNNGRGFYGLHSKTSVQKSLFATFRQKKENKLIAAKSSYRRVLTLEKHVVDAGLQ